ncbi:GGDEF domain-containing protein [Phytoactinopolyspora limicola]|uniref:GGDEF domain-containing protein n=1 Tax=Phytoactinopolyspora limicola TaxID=2715536 RepID=UPI00140B44FE|nr:GGDEF domain-containing protein [Phytoactinopolyspora limicola]
MIRRPWRWIRGWALWRVPKPVLALILTVNAVALVVTAQTAGMVDINSSDLGRFSLLAGCAWAAIEVTRRVENRRSFAHRPLVAYVDSTSVWIIAAVIVLPPALAAAIVIFTRFLMWTRVKNRKAVPYRQIYSTAATLLGAQAAILVLATGVQTYPGLPGGIMDVALIVVAAGLNWAVNFGLIWAALALFNPTARVSDLLSDFNEQILEAGAAALGMLVAVAIVASPLVLPTVIVVMIALHRGLLVSQYEHAARIDSKTGLATAGRWHEFAEEMVARARHHQNPLGLLVIDLDHFKSINDTYGHPFGDDVLRAVADELRSEVRELDACGRWGGEEFTVVLPDIDTEENVHRVAERIRLRIQSIALEAKTGDGGHTPVSLSASVGGVLYKPDDTTTLDELILAADSALYDAKNLGRNTVCLRSIVPTDNSRSVADNPPPRRADADT